MSDNGQRGEFPYDLNSITTPDDSDGWKDFLFDDLSQQYLPSSLMFGNTLGSHRGEFKEGDMAGSFASNVLEKGGTDKTHVTNSVNEVEDHTRERRVEGGVTGDMVSDVAILNLDKEPELDNREALCKRDGANSEANIADCKGMDTVPKEDSKESEKTKEADNNYPRDKPLLESWCRPQKVEALIQKFSNSQKDCIKQLGFGAFLEMRCGRLAKELCLFLLQRFDHESCTLTVGGKDYKITVSDFERVMGVKDGGLPVILTGSARTVQELREKYHPSSRGISRATVAKELTESNSIGKDFLQAFTLYIAGEVLGPITSAYLNAGLMYTVCETEIIRKRNWATWSFEYMVDNIGRWRSNGHQHCSGCLLFLQLYYLESRCIAKEIFDFQVPALQFFREDRIEQLSKETFEDLEPGKKKPKGHAKKRVITNKSTCPDHDPDGIDTIKHDVELLKTDISTLSMKIDTCLSNLDKLLQLEKTRGLVASKEVATCIEEISTAKIEIITVLSDRIDSLSIRAADYDIDGLKSNLNGNDADFGDGPGSTVKPSEDKNATPVSQKGEELYKVETSSPPVRDPIGGCSAMQTGRAATCLDKGKAKLMHTKVLGPQQRSPIGTRNASKRKDAWVKLSPFTDWKKAKTRYSAQNVGPFRGLVALTDDERMVVLYIYDTCSAMSEYIVRCQNEHLTRGSLQTLKPGRWIDSDVICMWVEFLVLREKKNHATDCFNWYLPSRFSQAILDPSIDTNKYIIKQKILQRFMYDLYRVNKIFIVMHDDKPEHWYLLVIDKPKLKCEIWDTLTGSDVKDRRIKASQAVLQVLDEYLYADRDRFIGNGFTFGKMEVKNKYRMLRQDNDDDCGMFVIKFMNDPESVNHAPIRHNSHWDRFRQTVDLVLSYDNILRSSFVGPSSHESHAMDNNTAEESHLDVSHTYSFWPL